MLQRCNELSICQQWWWTRKTLGHWLLPGTVKLRHWQLQPRGHEGIARMPRNWETQTGDGGVGADQADQADPSSKPIRETLKYSGTTRPHTAFSRPQPIKTKVKCHWLGATHHPNALLCLEMPCQGLFEIRRIDFAKSGEIWPASHSDQFSMVGIVLTTHIWPVFSVEAPFGFFGAQNARIRFLLKHASVPH